MSEDEGKGDRLGEETAMTSGQGASNSLAGRAWEAVTAAVWATAVTEGITEAILLVEETSWKVESEDGGW